MDKLKEKSEKSIQRRGRPLMGEAKRTRVSFTIPPRLSRWLREQAHAQKTSQSKFAEGVFLDVQKGMAPSMHDEGGSLKSTRIQVELPRDLLTRFCQQAHVKRLSLFGSVLRSDFGPDSDIDLMVEFLPGKTPSLFAMVAFEDELSKMFKERAVDLRTPREISPYFRDEVVGEAEVIYEA